MQLNKEQNCSEITNIRVMRNKTNSILISHYSTHHLTSSKAYEPKLKVEEGKQKKHRMNFSCHSFLLSLRLYVPVPFLLKNLMFSNSRGDSKGNTDVQRELCLLKVKAMLLLCYNTNGNYLKKECLVSTFERYF